MNKNKIGTILTAGILGTSLLLTGCSSDDENIAVIDPSVEETEQEATEANPEENLEDVETDEARPELATVIENSSENIESVTANFFEEDGKTMDIAVTMKKGSVSSEDLSNVVEVLKTSLPEDVELLNVFFLHSVDDMEHLLPIITQGQEIGLSPEMVETGYIHGHPDNL